MKDELKRKILKKLLPKMIPLLLSILISICLFAVEKYIIESIVQIVDKILQELHDMFTNFGSWVDEKWASIKNFFGQNGVPIAFDPAQFETDRLDPDKIISEDRVSEMKAKLDQGIVTKIAGLDETMLKKIMLANFRDTYLDDTTVLIGMSNTDFGISDDTWRSYFKVWQEKDSDLTARMITYAGRYAADAYDYGKFFGKWGKIISLAGGAVIRINSPDGTKLHM